MSREVIDFIWAALAGIIAWLLLTFMPVPVEAHVPCGNADEIRAFLAERYGESLEEYYLSPGGTHIISIYTSVEGTYSVIRENIDDHSPSFGEACLLYAGTFIPA